MACWKSYCFISQSGQNESIFGNQNTWPEHNKGVAPIPHPDEIGPLGVGATIVFVASDIVSFSQGVRAIQLGPWETG